jgi:UDP-2,3-diacylglucosamine pyrophosphatase LpxH
MVHEFDKLYAISDLHLGGETGRRVFRETDALVWLIQQVRNDPGARVALLLNGDIVDFLADAPTASEFNLAPEVFVHALGVDEEYRPLFDALTELLNTDNRFLVLQLGNHDIELALPAARQAFLKRVGADDTVKAQRVTFETSGRGWTCNVGRRLLLAVHGNASDPWNAVDHVSLEAARAALETGHRPVPIPTANPGTTLVVRVMNAIKRDFPFVDLLKPEDAPLMAVLAAVNARKSVSGLLTALARRLGRGHYRELLGAEPVQHAAGVDVPEAEISTFIDSIDLPAPDTHSTMLRVEQFLNDRKRVRALVDDDREQLGYVIDAARVGRQRVEAGIDRLRNEPDLAALRRALVRWLARDESFDVGRLSTIDLRIVDSAPPGIDLVIAGHTHLPRAQFGAPEYINTGTWMRVLKLNDTPYLASDVQFQPFFEAITQGTLKALDDLNIDPRQRPVAVVDANSAGLFSVAGNAPDFRLDPLT